MSLEERIRGILDAAAVENMDGTLAEQADQIFGEEVPVELIEMLSVALQSSASEITDVCLRRGVSPAVAVVSGTFTVFLLGVAVGKGIGIELGEKLAGGLSDASLIWPGGRESS